MSAVGAWLRTKQPLSSRWLMGMPQSPLCKPKQVTETSVSSKNVPKITFTYWGVAANRTTLVEQMAAWDAPQPSVQSKTCHKN